MAVIRKEEIDFSKFVPEVETYLVNVRDGSPGGEQEALLRTLRESPHLTSDIVEIWQRDADFRAALEYAREAGDLARAYDARMAAQRQDRGDLFSQPPPRGAFDPFAVTDHSSARGGGPTVTPPRQGLRHLLRGWRKIAAENEAAKAAAQATSAEPEPDDPLAQKFISLDDPALPFYAPAYAVRRDNVRSADGETSASERAKRIADGTYIPPNITRGSDGL